MNGETKADLLAMGFAPTPVLRAIRAKCLDCSGGSRAEVAACPVRSCALYPFRFGSNPWRAEATDARRESARVALAKRQKAGTIPGFGTTAGAAATSLPANSRTHP